ncbi:MAG: reprolysin-like metallopeptidase [Ferruginibacter sp.]
MKPSPARILLCFIFSLSVFNSFSQNIFFRDVAEASFNQTQKRVIKPSKYRTLSLDKSALIGFFKSVPGENNIGNRGLTPVIEIPMPSGGTARFHIWESSVMDPKLAAQFPDIKTFTGQGIDDPTANIKLDITPAGFHAMVISSLNGSVFIDPYAQGNTSSYISYNKIDFTKAGKFNELPLVKSPGKLNRAASPSTILAGSCLGTQLRTYRLALAANGEYTTFQGGTVALAMAAEATTMNRVNGVYERELSIRMVLVANNNLLIYTDGTTDPYTNANTNNEMLTENQSNVDLVIGSANYDIGHVFSTGGGGVAVLAGVCKAGQKAQGVTGTNAPVGDPFDIDYVAHEMGHQFGASHPFNSVLGACGGNGSSTTNAEPGSGSTIMAYAGICGSDDLQANSDAQFHAVSLNEISANTLTGTGNGCAVVTATGNTPPIVNAGADYVIPKSTAFQLTGSGSDANGDVLTYSWEQIDVGGPFGAWDSPSGNAPIFRSRVPVATPVRNFPSLFDQSTNSISKGELLPSYARTLHFRLTARDNRAGGGGVCFDESAVTVDGNSGPFFVTYPTASGISWYVNEFKTVTWNPNGTAFAPVNCSNVSIELSTDGGFTFPVILAASTANDGTEEIQVPNNITNKARIRVRAVGNVFYDISNVNFLIQNSPATEFVFSSPVPAIACGGNSIAVDLKTAGLNGFNTAINLSAIGNPGGTTVSFSTNPVTPGNTTTVTLNNTGGLASGTYNVTINGVAGAVNKSRIIPFVVSAIPLAPTSLTTPANYANGVSASPSFNWTSNPSALSYILEISTSNTFSPITQTISNITSLPYLLLTPLVENTLYYWRVKSVNSCGTGTASFSGIFKTGITTCKNSTDVPKAISASGAPSVTSTITIPASAGVVITDLNVVGLKGTHSYINDITVRLKSPAGNTVILFDKICDAEQNFDLNLDDEAAITTFPCPPVGGLTIKPQNPLSAFDGQNSTGVWTLTVKDNFDGDGGSLDGWGLYINNCLVITTPINSAPAYTQLCPPTAGTSLISSLTGTAYQWQVNTGSGFTNVTNNANYAGATTGTLQITNAPSAWNGYQYRCVVDAVNSTVLTLGFTSYWSGTVSNDWNNAMNWSCNSVPDANTDVYINSGAVVVNNANAVCRTLNVNPGASVTVGTGFKITVMH